MFINNSNECYFNITDMSLIIMLLDDVMENDEDNESTDQFFLNQVFDIRQGINKLVSISLIKKKMIV